MPSQPRAMGRRGARAMPRRPIPVGEIAAPGAPVARPDSDVLSEVPDGARPRRDARWSRHVRDAAERGTSIALPTSGRLPGSLASRCRRDASIRTISTCSTFRELAVAQWATCRHQRPVSDPLRRRLTVAELCVPLTTKGSARSAPCWPCCGPIVERLTLDAGHWRNARAEAYAKECAGRCTAFTDTVRWLTAEITKLEVEGLKVASVDVEGDCEVGMRKSKMCGRDLHIVAEPAASPSTTSWSRPNGRAPTTSRAR